jgi:hypothetical protein
VHRSYTLDDQAFPLCSEIYPEGDGEKGPFRRSQEVKGESPSRCDKQVQERWAIIKHGVNNTCTERANAAIDIGIHLHWMVWNSFSCKGSLFICLAYVTCMRTMLLRAPCYSGIPLDREAEFKTGIVGKRTVGRSQYLGKSLG